jgi:hypothetical protein
MVAIVMEADVAGAGTKLGSFLMGFLTDVPDLKANSRAPLSGNLGSFALALADVFSY